MSEKKRFVQSKYANHLQDIKTDTHYYLTSEKIGCKDLFDEIERLTEENEQLKILNSACKNGQKNLMKEMEKNDEALDKIWEIIKKLYGVIDDE